MTVALFKVLAKNETKISHCEVQSPPERNGLERHREVTKRS